MTDIVTRPSAVYSENFDAIFRSKKVYYAVEFKDGFQDYMTFLSSDDAKNYYEKNKNQILTFEEQQLLEG